MNTVSQLIDAMQALPEDWVLTPVRGKKACLPAWQNLDSPLSRERVAYWVEQPKWTGFGIVLGRNYICVDFDGEESKLLALHISGLSTFEKAFPPTVAWTSGKEGRHQRLYRIPNEFQLVIKSKKVTDFNEFKCSEGQQLEFRYTGNQSVLPPSIHPDTKKPYTYIESPLKDNSNISMLPNWALEYLSKVSQTESPSSNSKRTEKELSKNQQKFLNKALLQECERVRNANDGDRNSALNRASYNLGKYIKAGLEKQTILDTLEMGASDCGLIEDDGIEQVKATIESGIKAGMKHPKRIPNSSEDKDKKISDNLGVVYIIEEEYADRLRYNLLSNEILLDGKPLESEEVFIEILKTHDKSIGIEILERLLRQYSKRNSFNPVYEYFESLVWDGIERIRPLAIHLFGDKFIYQSYFEKWLISGVARTYKPGCKADSMLILQSESQGWGKSTFFEILGKEWYGSLGEATFDKDWHLKLHRNFINDFSEFDQAFRKKDIGRIKEVLTTCEDQFRPPFGRRTENFPRNNIFCGSTNEADFLSDTTGNRRYWIIPLTKPLDLERVREETDQLWAEAVAKFKQAIGNNLQRITKNSENIWWLDESECELRNEENKYFETSDPWEDYMPYLLEKAYNSANFPCQYSVIKERFITVSVILTTHGIEEKFQDKQSQMRVARILQKLGFTKKQILFCRKRINAWYFPLYDHKLTKDFTVKQAIYNLYCKPLYSDLNNPDNPDQPTLSGAEKS